MKKFPIHLFTTFAFIFSIASAFTVKPQKKLLSIYAVWGIASEEVPHQYYPPVDFNLLHCSIDEVLFSNIFPLTTLGITSLEQYKENYDNGELMCYANNDFVCMAYVRYDANYLLQGTVLEVLDGDYDHIYY